MFFSNKYAGRGDLFEGLVIWKEEQYRLLQGTYPVLAMGYLKVVGMVKRGADEETCYTLALTNFEVARMFRRMVKGWFEGDGGESCGQV